MKYNWKEIQEDYDLGLSYNKLIEKYGMCSSTIANAVRRKDLITRDRKIAQKLWSNNYIRKPTSEETKKKISEARIKYLKENPDKVPYLTNHSSKKSYPEIIFENALLNKNIKNYIYNYQNGIYQYDFAFPDFKIDVEIDGATHNTEKVKLIDKKRDEWSIKEGWKVIRFPAWKVKENVEWCINELFKLMNEIAGFNFNILKLEEPIKYTKKEYFCNKCKNKLSDKRSIHCRKCSNELKKEKTKIDWLSNSELLERLKTSSYKRLSKELGVSDNTIRKRIKNYST